MRRTRRAALLTVAAMLAACAETPALPNLTEIYAPAAADDGSTIRAPLIVVPGTLGSRLVDSETGRVVWGGGSAGISADPDDPEEASLLALPIPDGMADIASLADSVRPAGVLDTAKATIFGIPIDIEIYGGISRTLLAGGFRSDQGACGRLFAMPGPARDQVAQACPLDTEGGTDWSARAEDAADDGSPSGARTLRFDYDWRRDLPGLAIEFDTFVKAEAARIAEDRSRRVGRPVSPDEIRFDLLAHSMGGLLTRYYLMHGPADLPADGSLPPITWEGARHFSRVVFVAPPNAGSMIALENLVNGKELGPFQPFYPGYLLATHANAWQLMPRARHRAVRWDDIDGEAVLDLYDPALWVRYGWGLADPEAGPFLALLMPEETDAGTRRARALAHQARLLKRAEQFHRAIDRWAEPPPHLRLFLVVGGGLKTPSVVTVERDTGAMRIVGVEEGDGVVTRASALLDERPTSDERTALISPLEFDTVLLLPDEHVELTRNPVFGDNLLFWLLEQPREAEVVELAQPAPSADSERRRLLGLPIDIPLPGAHDR